MKLTVLMFIVTLSQTLHASEAFTVQYICTNEENSKLIIALGNKFDKGPDWSDQMEIGSPQEILRCNDTKPSVLFINSIDDEGNIESEPTQMNNTLSSVKLINGETLEITDEISESYEVYQCQKQLEIPAETICD